MPDQDVLYFAYGSNLNRSDWEQFCARRGYPPDAVQPLTTALLPDRQLVFDYRSVSRRGGVLDLRPAPAHLVPGVLHRVTALGWQALDAKEGAPHCYERVSHLALTADGARVPVVTYAVVPDRRQGFVPPTPSYVEIVAQGLRAWGLSTAPLERAAQDADPPAAVDALFVYGTLLPGECRAGAIPRERMLGRVEAVTAGSLHATAGDYPALRCPLAPGEPDQGPVRGECLQIADLPSLLPVLDRIEGFGGYADPAGSGSLFHRTLLTVTTADGCRVSAWAYVAAPGCQLGAVIAGGCWRRHRQDAARGG